VNERNPSVGLSGETEMSAENPSFKVIDEVAERSEAVDAVDKLVVNWLGVILTGRVPEAEVEPCESVVIVDPYASPGAGPDPCCCCCCC